ncbi:MAG: sigma-70 family RNA polymerase sigma factor [Oscillospiraceae bacterium]|nr:sigma-70 family RNA polymerase sigma factor [Oscillospiraceae bacterium]
MDTIEFEKLFLSCKSILERFVYYKMHSKSDGDDILQEVAISAFKHIAEIKNPDSLKPWILKIAANKCNDFYRNLAKRYEIPLDELTENIVSMNQYGISEIEVVRDTLGNMADKDKQILFLYYFKNKPQAEIASLMQIPVGTVKSRLHTAKQNFKDAYPFPPVSKTSQILKESKISRGEKTMQTIKTLPDIMPEYKITPSVKAPFDVKWEESLGWFIVPKLGEKITWAMYDFPERTRSEVFNIEVTGRANVHGIEGVEIVSEEKNTGNDDHKNSDCIRSFVAQLTETHCRILAESHTENGIKKIFTFLDGDDFLNNWGFGEDNCGIEVNLTQKGTIQKNGNVIISQMVFAKNAPLMDVVGRYDVEISGKTYDTVCLIDIELYNTGVLSEQYIDKNGRTVLWRRFNKNDWKYKYYNERYKFNGDKLWSEMFPNNEQMTVNGEIYVHWYDCITDYIL